MGWHTSQNLWDIPNYATTKSLKRFWNSLAWWNVLLRGLHKHFWSIEKQSKNNSDRNWITTLLLLTLKKFWTPGKLEAYSEPRQTSRRDILIPAISFITNKMTTSCFLRQEIKRSLVVKTTKFNIFQPFSYTGLQKISGKRLEYIKFYRF